MSIAVVTGQVIHSTASVAGTTPLLSASGGRSFLRTFLITTMGLARDMTG